MAWLALSKSGGSNYNPADLFWFKEIVPANSFFTEFNRIGHPFGVGLFDDRVAITHDHLGRAYGFSGFSDNWLCDEFKRVWRLGMLPPPTVPVITAGAGTTKHVPYTSFWDAITEERSPLSSPGAEITGNNALAWTGLPTEEPGYKIKIEGTTVANAVNTIVGVGTSFTLLRPGDKIAMSSAPTLYGVIRVITSDTSITLDRPLGNGTTQTMTVVGTGRPTHVELWDSVDGALPRLVVRRQLGPTTATTNVATLALGEAAPDTFQRIPRCSFGVIYHERLVAAGDVNNPDTLYVGVIGFPERWEGLTFHTRNGEAITGLAIAPGDILLVTTAINTYALRGWTESDLTLQLVDPELGAFHHWAIHVLHGRPWVANPHGIFMWNGAYHLILRDRQEEWQKDYQNNRAIFEKGFATHIPDQYVYQYVLPVGTSGYVSSLDVSGNVPVKWYLVGDNGSGNISLAWTADYLSLVPELAGDVAQPDWSIDKYGFQIRCSAVLTIPGTKRAVSHYGMCDGYVRNFGQDMIGSDDGQSFKWYVRTAALFMGDPLGDGQEGKTFTRLWSHIQAEATAWKAYALGGDDEGWQHEDPDNTTYFFLINEVASAFTGPGGIKQYAPKTIHEKVLERVSGRALTMIYQATDPGDLRFKGFAGEYGPGVATRLPLLLNPPI